MRTVLIGEDATIAEIDEALTYAQQVPSDQRGSGWHAFVDRLLEMRANKNTGAMLDAAPMFSDGDNRGSDKEGVNTGAGRYAGKKTGHEYTGRNTRVMKTPETR